MEVKLLKKGYKKNEQFHHDFINDQLKYKDEYFSGDVVEINEAPDFPIYMGKGSEEEKKQLFYEAFKILSRSFLDTDRDLHFDELFWHSLLVTEKREYLLENYPQITSNIKEFNNIVLKKFDWESYIYKCVLGAQYISDIVSNESERLRYYELLVNNLDVYNYIIKYEIFRNDSFLINILDIIDEMDLSKVMKAKITDRDDLGKDERIGRRVIFEFNKSYPIVMAPMMDKEDLKEVFLGYLGLYYDVSQLYELV
ncbi:hypothetical protein [Niallia taxi]|uniref:hypothetical protein n=1 Tax=Niallia taxi TaxID=2499688 RepID=UPI003D2AF5FE